MIDFGYGSGTSSSNSLSTWPAQGIWSSQDNPWSIDKPSEQKSKSYQALVTGKCTLEDIMNEFKMNGLDSPYTPDENRIWANTAGIDNPVEPASVAVSGPVGAYLRQKSWPAPERSPAPRLPRPRGDWLPEPEPTPRLARPRVDWLPEPEPATLLPRPSSDWLPEPEPEYHEFMPTEFTASTPVNVAELPPPPAPKSEPALSEEQVRVLSSLPNTVLFYLLHKLDQDRAGHKRKKMPECRFCKNNGERESYYRSHTLKDTDGRVACPVLRVFVCKRCGASGDSAHTIKYCPFSTADERMMSAAMMRSVRSATGRRRHSLSVSPTDHYMETTPSVVSDNKVYNSYGPTSPLDPLWEALEKKLMI